MALFFHRSRGTPDGGAERGQVTVLTAILVGILATSLILTTDLTRVVGKRLATQNAADAAALAMATWQARGLNTLTYLNYAVAAALFIYIIMAIKTMGATAFPFPPPYLKPIWTMQDMVRAYITVPALPHALGLAHANHVQFGMALADSRPRRVPIYGLGSWWAPMPLHAERQGLFDAISQFLARLGLRLPRLPRPLRWLYRFLRSLRIGFFYHKIEGPNERGWGVALDASTSNRLLRVHAGPHRPGWREEMTRLRMRLSASGALGRFVLRGIGQSVSYSRRYRNESGSFLLFVPNWEAALEKFSQGRFQGALRGYGGGLAGVLARAGLQVPSAVSAVAGGLFGWLLGSETARVRH